MNPIAISEILVVDRIRRDYPDDGLEASIKRYGTIQPIVLEPLPDGAFRLIAGGRRLAALKALGYTQVYHGSTYNPTQPGYVLGAELTEDQLTELELEENIRRKSMSWQEECLSIAKTHRLRIVRCGELGESWGQAQTGRLLNMAAGSVNNVLWVASMISNNPEHPIWKMGGLVEALQYKLKLSEDEAFAELARRQQQAAAVVEYIAPEPDLKEAARERYLFNPHNDPAAFEAYYETKQQESKAAPVVHVTPRLHRGNCLEYMNARPGTFDHIITDPPYAIDMDNLEQNNLGMSNIGSVRETHKVDDNLVLLNEFIIAAYNALKPDGFLIMWCDQDVWSWLKEHAGLAKFKVQRWPITWVKTHACQNSQAAYNFTKTTEIAMVCRKGNAQMVELNTPTHIIAGHDEFKQRFDHPFVKPFAVWEHLINAVSIKGQSILDPFAGEGSGVISALRLERNYFGCELDDLHYNKLLENVMAEYLALDPNTMFK